MTESALIEARLPAAPDRRRRFLSWRLRQAAKYWLGGFVLACALLANDHANAQRPPLEQPKSDSFVIERLPAGYSALHMQPTGDPASDIALAARMLDTAVRSGDARLASRAEALLKSSYRSPPSPQVLKLLARAAQYRHDFDQARALLDRAVAARPRDPHTRLYRAQVSLIQGNIRRALTDCAGLMLGIDAGIGELCLAAVTLRTGNLESTVRHTSRFLAIAADDHPYVGYALLVRAHAALRCGRLDSSQWFARALHSVPGDVHTLAAYARSLRYHGRPELVRPLLADHAAHDGLHLQLALAALESNAPDADRLKYAQAQRYHAARASGVEPEPRDEAEFHLTLIDDPKAALSIAQENFRIQRDHEDADILRRSALAADRQDVLASLAQWENSQGILAEDYECPSG